MQTISVDLGSRAYSIHIGPGSREILRNWLTQHAPGRQLVVIADATVAELHWDALRTLLPDHALLLTFPAGEASKTLDVARDLYTRLAAARIERGAVIATLGGGVAGDLGGFVSATWLRGVRYVQLPTTLLAAVDASVGGKTAVNLPEGKNLVGSFHQPAAVIVDTEFLQTLPDRDFTAGLGECVKHAALHEPAEVKWLEDNASALVARDPGAVSDIIARDCEIKAGIVVADERELGLRAVLNLGHTIGHAIEHVLGYELRHGECVGLGMLVENEISRSRGWLPERDAERVAALLARLRLPVRLSRAVEADAIVASCRLDKKTGAGATNFVLLRQLGQPQRGVSDVREDELASALRVIQPA